MKPPVLGNLLFLINNIGNKEKLVPHPVKCIVGKKMVVTYGKIVVIITSWLPF